MTDLKKLLAPTEWNAKLAGQPWAMPLRDPYLVHELDASGLRNLPEYEGWRQRSIPRVCQKLAPCKFFLQPCEITFQRQHLPGVFQHILKDLLYTGADSG